MLLKGSLMKKIIELILRNPKIYSLIQNIHRDFELEKKYIRENISSSKIKFILDYGCGSGEFSEIFKDNYYVGIDTNFKLLNFAKEKHNKDFVLVSKKLPFKDNSFDLIILVSILHHIGKEEVIELLNNISDLLSSSGILLISEPLSNNKQNYLTKFLMFLEKMCRGVYFFDKDELRDILAGIFKIRNEKVIKFKIHLSQIYVLGKKLNITGGYFDFG